MTTITATKIIEEALSLLGVLALGERADGDVLVDALDFLNNMIESWSMDDMNIVTIQHQILSCPPGTAYITIGPGGMINVDRPTQVENGAFFRISTLDYHMQKINRLDYDAIVNKNVQATYPSVYYYDANLPLAKVFIWPLLAGTGELHLPIFTVLQQFADLTTAYTLPPGYKRAIMYSLAEEMGPTYRTVTDDIRRIASKSRMQIRRTNTRIPTLSLPNILDKAGRFNILSNTRV